MEAKDIKVRVGSKIYCLGEKRPYKVTAFNDRYIIATKPFNPRKTFQYTILDLSLGIQGPDNMIFGPAYDYSILEEAAQAVKDLVAGTDGLELSSIRRRSVTMDIQKIIF
jgi:hypothetical protein